MPRRALSKTACLLLLVPLACLAEGSVAADGPALVHKYGCLSCHGMVRAQVGPGFAQIAARYRDDPSIRERLPSRISGGGVGTWGRVIMPRQHGMTETEAHLLADWVLSQPSPP